MGLTSNIMQQALIVSTTPAGGVFKDFT